MPYAAFHADLEVLTKPDRADLERVAVESDRPGVLVFGWPFSDLHELAALPARVVTLKISGAPSLASLDGVERAPHLQELVLATPTGSSGSGRQIRVDSFAPLQRLPHLHRLILHSVRPDDLDLAPIMRMSQLEELDISGIPELGVEDYGRLAGALPQAAGRGLRPFVVIPGIGRCKRCGGQESLLNGAPPRARRFVCPTCSPKLLAAHVSKWEQAAGRTFVQAN